MHAKLYIHICIHVHTVGSDLFTTAFGLNQEHSCRKFHNYLQWKEWQGFESKQEPHQYCKPRGRCVEQQYMLSALTCSSDPTNRMMMRRLTSLFAWTCLFNAAPTQKLKKKWRRNRTASPLNLFVFLVKSCPVFIVYTNRVLIIFPRLCPRPCKHL